MGSGDHDTGVAVVVTGGKAQRGNRHQSVVDADLDAVGSQNLGSSLGKHIALDAAVVADGNGLGAALSLDPVGQALSGLTDNIHIHAVGASAQHAAQTGGAELQGDGKTLLDLIIVAFDGFQLGLHVGIVQLSGEPALVIIDIHSTHLSF